MATAARQSKPPRKGPDPAARRTNAWTGARASPTYSPAPANARLPNGNQQGPPGAFPPLANANGARPPAPTAEHNRVLSQISGLTGTTVTITTKNNLRFEGVVASTTPEGDTTGVTLKDVKEVNTPGAPLRETHFIAATNIQEWTSGPADAKIPNGADTFKTDTDISKTGGRRERELQAWQPESADANGAAAPGASGPANPRNVDELTFGPGASGGSWDQFAVNEKLFGVKAGFDEDAYTTKLDRNAPDYKEKERKAQQLANEIMNSAVNNVHVAEERIMNLTNDGSAANEEDKYGAVVRGANAYVPPGARKTGSATTPPAKSEVPKVAVNAPDGAAVPSSTTASTPTGSKVPSPAPSGAAAKQPADAVPAFRNFVSTEKDRLLKKKQALMKSEMDKRLSDLVNFSKSFKLNKPIPDDLVPILAKDEDKQRAIKEKSTRDAEDTKARAIGVSNTIAATPGVRPVPAPGKAGVETSRAAAAAKPAGTSAAGSSMQKTSTAPSKPGESKKISMIIQPIPPFKGKRASTAAAPSQLQPVAPAATNGSAKAAPSPLSPTAQNRLNVNASSFRPTVKAFSPGASPSPSANGATSSASANGKQAQSENVSPQGPPNPFFGTRVIKKSPPVHVKDDFNPFKHHKVIEAAQVGA
ncbi:LsmAD domain-containing protein [Dichomitus squalens]|uniref:LsmAD domain-containing protein n=1 Tax=Dichomitus squalens TaxID=114155 RepID=A0A4V2JZS8_9APHY|nr:LsmAD domain-containing protein [Dichomitus squalens]